MSEILTNRMQVAADVLEPPTETVKFWPIKDAYLSQEMPVFPFGNGSTLLVQKSPTTAYKTIMAFDISIDEEKYENLVGSKLTLYFEQKIKRNTDLIIRFHEDDGWQEYGTTWASQPLEYNEVFKTVHLYTGMTSVSIDMTQLIKDAGVGTHHYAFTISEDNYYDQITNISMYSRESNEKVRPVWTYTYRYYPGLFDLQYLPVDFTVSKKDNKDLRGYISVRGGTLSTDFPASLTVNGYTSDDTDNTKGTMLVTFTAMHPGIAELLCELSPQRHVPNEFEPAPDLPVYFGVREYTANEDLLVSGLTVNGYSGEGVDLVADKFFVRGQSDLTTDIYVKSIKYADEPAFRGNVIVKLYKKNNDLKCDFTVKRTIPHEEEPALPVELNISLKDGPDSDMYVTLTTKPGGEDDMECIISVNGYEGEPQDMGAKMHVFMTSDMQGYLIPVIDKGSNMKCTLTVRPWYMEDMLCTFTTEKSSNAAYAYIT